MAAFSRWFNQFLARRHGIQRGELRLDRRRIYILPTGYGVLFAAMLMLMLLWAINYTNSLSFVLTFLLAAVGLTAMWRTHNNLLDLQIAALSAESVFVGQHAQFRYELSHPDANTRYGIALSWPGQELCFTDVLAQQRNAVTIPLLAEQRGRLTPGRLRIATRFPLGLFEAWSWVTFDQQVLIYPQPQGERRLPETVALNDAPEDRVSALSGHDDFAGLRTYVAGDSPRHVAWRASAGKDQLLVKQFHGHSGAELWLLWDVLTPMATEARLSQLCQWVLQAAAKGCDYGLRLPHLELAPDHGETHKRRCLQALALYDLETPPS